MTISYSGSKKKTEKKLANRAPTAVLISRVSTAPERPTFLSEGGRVGGKRQANENEDLMKYFNIYTTCRIMPRLFVLNRND